jgi:hypothetical protein
MHSDVLVTADIVAGRELLAVLDRYGFMIDTAYWYRSDENQSDWRLVLVPRKFESLRACYTKLSSLADKPDFPPRFRFGGLSFQRPDDAVVRAIEKAVEQSKEEITKISRAFVDGLYIEEAIVMRHAGIHASAA